MKPEDKNKLNQCLEILDTTDLGLSLVWLWTWSTIQNIITDDEWKVLATSDEMWDHLCRAVEAGAGFSLEFGAEQHYEEVLDWMLSNDYILDFNEDPSEN